jgi:hypothetical protein
MYGYGTQPLPNINNTNAGLELMPGKVKRVGGVGVEKNRLVEKAFSGPGVRRERPRELIGNGSNSGGGGRLSYAGNGHSSTSGVASGSGTGMGMGSVSIMGAAKSSVWVKVENLAMGTTVEDLTVSVPVLGCV